ncbi:expressed unknown protein [Seminavis robusta]|uniref:DUF1990 domain-containing protein n=1 Tax=Seminavis robusta TaxID=568900 RepID=A0A9N8DFI8_9STRA|nr:expressed unknown protein [Seminavis robusta]|eukprot:Sro68_g038030.1 n/a (456) ;mRNA; r:43912-45451
MMILNCQCALLLLFLSIAATHGATASQRCQNSCLAPSTPTSNNNSNSNNNATPNNSIPATTLSDKAPDVSDNKESSSVWGSMKNPFKRPAFDIVPLPRLKPQKKKQRRPKEELPPKAATVKQHQPSGTRFDLRPPSPERIARWFAPAADDNRQLLGGSTRKTLFNHDSVGMTNPVLHVSVEEKNNYLIDDDTASTVVSLANSDTTTTFELQDTWIPASTTTTHSTPPSSREATRVWQYKVRAPPPDATEAEQAWFPAALRTDKWRQCRYRRRVGQGQECYERVREAALAWQFRDSTNKGILPVQQQQRSDKENNCCFALNDQASQQVQPLWSGPHTQGSRRLVTFTTTGFKTRWLPKLYTMNPVMVVYDLLDQRGPATTYSSTAYATLRGHLLRGEERVTVAFRDDTGFVDVEILSYSKPAGSLKAKCAWPLIGKMQQQFFQHQMDHLEQVAAQP